MYISLNGTEIVSPKYQVADSLIINMSIDRSDTPLSYYGITQNINKDNYLSTIAQLKLSILDFLQYCKLTNVNLDDVIYTDNKFTALFSYNGNKVSIPVE